MRVGIHLFVLFAFAPAVWGQDPAKTQINKQAKAATALVEVQGGFKQGSAFCIHDSGLFVTNHHVVGRGRKSA